MKKKIKINVVLLGLLIAGVWLFGYLSKSPIINEVEVIKEVVITDTIYQDKIVEEIVYVPKYITKIKRDTVKVEVIKEIVTDKPVNVLKEVYVDKVVSQNIEVPVNESKLFLGLGFQYDLDNYFSGADIRLMHKTPKDKVFSLDVGFRNDLLDSETGIGELRPYVGASMYFRIDKR